MDVLRMGLVAVFAGFLLTGHASAQHLYKCKKTSGQVEFTDAPCTADLSDGRIRATTNSLDFSGQREHLLRQENEKLKEQLRAQQATGSASAQRTGSDLQAERIDSFACEKAKRDYEVTASSTSNSKAIIEAKRSMMYGTCGMREPDRNSTTVNTRVIVR